MASKILSYRSKLTGNLSTIRTRLENIEMPERFKGTIVEKWAKYWKSFGADYKEAAINFYEEAQAKPLKTAIYGTLGTAVYLCAQRNPEEIDYVERLREYNNDMILVSESCHKPEASSHLKYIERCINEGVLRRLTLGIASVMWIADYDKSVSIYKAMCPHLQFEYSKFAERVVDIGFWNKWWLLEQKMEDFDVNI